MARPGDNQFQPQESDQQGAGNSASAFHADSNLADPKNQRVADKTQVAQVADDDLTIMDGEKYIKKFGTDEDFIKAQATELRTQFGLPANATSKQFYEAVADDALFKVRHKDAEDRDLALEGLRNFGIAPKDATRENLVAAMLKRDGGVSSMPFAQADYEKAERTMHERFLADIRSGDIRRQN
jgi:hypothetical protein